MMSQGSPLAYERLDDFLTSQESTPPRKSHNFSTKSHLTKSFSRRNSAELSDEAVASELEPLVNGAVYDKKVAGWRGPAKPRRSSPHPNIAIMPRSSTWSNVPPSTLPQPISGQKALPKDSSHSSQSTTWLASSSRKPSPPSRIPTPIGGRRHLSDAKTPPSTRNLMSSGGVRGANIAKASAPRKSLPPVDGSSRLSDAKQHAVSSPYLLSSHGTTPRGPQKQAADEFSRKWPKPRGNPSAFLADSKENHGPHLQSQPRPILKHKNVETGFQNGPRNANLSTIPRKPVERQSNREASIVQDTDGIVLFTPVSNGMQPEKSFSEFDLVPRTTIAGVSGYFGIPAPYSASPAVSDAYGERISVSNAMTTEAGVAGKVEDERTPLVARLKSSLQVRSSVRADHASYETMLTA